MSRKRNTPQTPTTDLQTVKIGSRVRCTDDGVEGRITWANGAAVKIEWADGEKVTWKRADLAGKGLEVLDADESPVEQATTELTQAEPPATANMPPVQPFTPEPAPVEQDPPTPVQETPGERVSVDQVAPDQPPAEQTPPVEQATTEQNPVVEPTPTKKARVRKADADDGRKKKLSALDAAAKVLGEVGRPMTCQEMIDAMAAKSYWASPGGQTPAATLYSAILRELGKGKDARFVKTERGKFGLKG